MSRAILKRTFKVAERIQHLLDERGVRSALIGAMACAAWGYPRHTRDFDLGCLASLGVLEDLARVLAKPGLEIELRTPDSDDPLGGMLIISGKGLRRIELINFLNPYRPGRKNPAGSR